MLKKYNAYLIAVIFLTTAVQAQNPNLNLEWVKSMGTAQSSLGVSYSATSQVNSSGDVYTAGCFFDTMDFDPGPGIYNLSGSLFIQKLDDSGNFIWAKSIVASARIRGFSLDVNGNLYLTGNFGNTSDFDPGPGVFNLIYKGGGSDIFVLKLDASGNFMWAVSMGSSNDDVGISVATDALGNVYSCGYFNGLADFDPGVGVFNLSSFNSSFFIQKLDASGNFIWAKAMGFGNIFSYSDYRVKVDSKGNIYTSGRFDGTADFDPGPGVFNLSVLGLGSDVFIQKLDPSGNFLWARSIEGTQLEVCRDFVIDANNNFCATGFFQGTADFDPGLGVASLTSNWTVAYIQKLDEAGNFLWANKTGKDSSTVIPCSIAIDSNQAILTTGYLYWTADFDPGLGVVNLSSAMYLQCMDASGNFNWARAMGNHANTTYPASIVVDANNAIYLTGVFSDTVDFDLEAGVQPLISLGNSDIFIQKMNQCTAISFSLGNDTTLCQGATLTLHSSTLKGMHLWQNNSTDSLLVANLPGKYWVTTSAGSCKVSDSLMLKFDQPISLQLGKDSSLCNGESVVLKATNSNGIYQWQDGANDSVYWVTKAGIYSVQVSNSCGMNHDEVNISYQNCNALFIPNSFTPNGDALNDVFTVVSNTELVAFELQIFDRWGTKVFESNTSSISWNGSYNATAAPTGVYAIKLSYRFSGTETTINKNAIVTLFR